MYQKMIMKKVLMMMKKKRTKRIFKQKTIFWIAGWEYVQIRFIP